VRITHYDTAFTRIEVGGVTVVTDPVLDAPGQHHHFGGGMRSTKSSRPPAFDAIGRFDAVLVSHDQHADNLDAAGRAILRDASMVISTTTAARRLDGTAVGLAPFAMIDVGDLRITATPARHGPPLSLPIVGPVIGFVLGASIYITGDTVMFAGVREVAARFTQIEVVVAHLGAASYGPLRFTMNAKEAVELARLFPHAKIVPVHYDGWTHFKQGKAEVVAAFARAGLTDRLVWLERGVPQAL
jgi:L-ascorbate metabolism protein UlaG (beta-lactamase superfamily)